MKVTMLRSPSTAWDCKLAEGQTGTVDALTGKRLVAAGIAVEIAEPKAKPVKAELVKPELKAVPNTPAIAEPKSATVNAETKPAAKAETTQPSPPKQRDKKPINKESKS